MTAKERLTEFLNYRRIGQAKFSSIAGLSRGCVNNIVNTIGPEGYRLCRLADRSELRDYVFNLACHECETRRRF